jgi:RNA polymerase II subunit A C-terminal domain phosphatase SSU72
VEGEIGVAGKMRLRHAMVCASNQNRSMEAHALLVQQGLDVNSYGTGAHVKLPGPSIREPNVYSFGTPYRSIFDDLKRKDPELYKRNGLLRMLKRNLRVKEAPQRWQDNAADGAFDVIFTFEERVFDMVIENLENREQRLMKSVLVINLEVKDNPSEAAVGARLVLDLCTKLEGVDSWEDEIDAIVRQFEKQHKRRLIYTISFY